MNAADIVQFLVKQRAEHEKTTEEKRSEALQAKRTCHITMEEKFWEAVREVARQNNLLVPVGHAVGELSLSAALKVILQPLLPAEPKPKPNYVGEVRHNRVVLAMQGDRHVVVSCLKCGHINTILTNVWKKVGHCKSDPGDEETSEETSEETGETENKAEGSAAFAAVKPRWATKGTPEERASIEAALRASNNHVGNAARLLKCSPRTIQRRMALYNL